MTKNFCKERVWDNGDMKDCGLEIRAHGYCVEHLEKTKKALVAKRKRLVFEMAVIDEELACLARRA